MKWIVFDLVMSSRSTTQQTKAQIFLSFETQCPFSQDQDLQGLLKCFWQIVGFRRKVTRTSLIVTNLAQESYEKRRWLEVNSIEHLRPRQIKGLNTLFLQRHKWHLLCWRKKKTNKTKEFASTESFPTCRLWEGTNKRRQQECDNLVWGRYVFAPWIVKQSLHKTSFWWSKIRLTVFYSSLLDFKFIFWCVLRRQKI